MKVVSSFYLVSEEDMENKKNVVIDDATKLHLKNQKKRPLVDKSSKGKQVTFEDDEVEIDNEAYVAITEDDIEIVEGRKRPKVTMAKNRSLQNVKTKKSRVEDLEVVITSSQEPSETSKESREIITPGADLGDGIIKTKQNAIRQNLTKRNLVDGGRTFQLNVTQTYKASEGQCQYQVRKPHHLHVHNLKTLMRYNPYAHVVSYVLLVDPLQVPNKEAFDKSKCFEYNYYVLGGNHSVEAQRQLMEEYPNNPRFETMKCIIYAGLNETEAKLVAWDHNSDNEYRMSMTLVQKVRFIHSEFLEKCGGDKINITTDFRKECCMEIGYQIEDKGNSKNGKDNRSSDLFRGVDNIFQLAFRTGDIWNLIDDIFSMWEDIGIKNQKVRKSKPLICSNNKSAPELKQLPDDMTITPWRAMQGVKDEKIVKTILSRVKSGELSLEEMSEEFQK